VQRAKSILAGPPLTSPLKGTLFRIRSSEAPFGVKGHLGRAAVRLGFWHQRQASEQPLKKTVVRTPGPSCSENRWMSKINASIDGSFGLP
jgi:hypothetical protein